MSKRIQCRNFFDYEWKKNPNAVYVARPSRWGNPYPVSEYGLDECLRLYEIWLREQLKKAKRGYSRSEALRVAMREMLERWTGRQL
jgi:hypothetical protein